MEFEWDDRKADSNLIKHGVGFQTATAVFTDERRRTEADLRHEYGELLFTTLGRVGEHVYVVTYTMRGDAVRIISVRKANRREVATYGAG